MAKRRWAALVLVTALAGCDGGSLVGVTRADTGGAFCFREDTGGFAAEESYTPSGCRFMLVGDSPSGESRLVLDVPAFAELYSGESVSTTYVLPDATVRLELEYGCDVSSDWCEETEGEPVVSVVYVATAGTPTVDGAPDDDGAVVTVTLTDVTFGSESDPTETRATIDALTWTDVRLLRP